ncbi:putative hydro-lyase [Streptomyces piniterrae]|uniref:Putative hydro-lyase FCH28_25700 n=2 Tax=Streptomyces piniterrae TaxID=2571125 RepID=A0A4U0N8H6_9ACTN|nr:putative hydro-lyase [Streptomyces piniterrae]
MWSTMQDSGSWTPKRARAAFRDGLDVPTSGLAPGHTQVNVLTVPREYAYDVLLFAQRNPVPCPVLEVTDPGSWRSVLAPGADLRTDLPGYLLWEEGQVSAKLPNATAVWREDLVTFLIGCSFSFETLLHDAGVPLRHVEQGTAVPMFLTNRPCNPAGRMHGPMVVSMRPIPARLVSKAVQVSGMMPAVHGAPVQIGDPEALGIRDLGRPDFGDPVEMRDGDVPVFWGCGVTTQAALMAVKPPFAISHIPGRMFITDVRDTEYRIA